MDSSSSPPPPPPPWSTRRTAEDDDDKEHEEETGHEEEGEDEDERNEEETEHEEEEEDEDERNEEETEHEEEDERKAPSLPLSLQALGACRADERSPLSLSLSVPVPSILLPIFAGPGPGPPAASRDRLLVHLTQLFEPAEIALLVRCLCAPLISVRVGVINKIGSLLCPIPSRGRLNLNMAPMSWLQISFMGDDGRTEQLISSSCNSSEVENVIIEEIAADASGRSFLVKVSESQVFYYWLSEKSLSHGLDLLDKMKDILRKRPTLSELTGISRWRLESLGSHLQASSASTSAHLSLMSSSQGGGSSFKDNSSSSPSNTLIDDIRDNKLIGRHIVIPSLPFNSAPGEQSVAQPSGAVPMPSLSASLPPVFSPPFNQFPLPPPDHAASMVMDDFKPQYCWCPMGPSSALPSLPPFAIPIPPVAASSSLPLPLPLPLPVSSLVIPPLPPGFSGLMSDPIVHLPVMDISSAGQAYLVSAGPSISTPTESESESESVLEMNARETLMRLLESNPIHGLPFAVDALSNALSSPSPMEDEDEETCDQEENKDNQETDG